MSGPAWETITDADHLARVAARLARAPAIAVDTEFVRRTTFYARPGLLQLSAGDGEFLVDLVALGDPAALRDLFLAPAPLKVMHSCGEDLEVLRRLFGAVPGSLVDTQVAAALLGHPLQTSYQKILRDVLGIDVPKDETQSDWTARPLTPAQLSYAALDVRHLLPLWSRLEAELAARGRAGWLAEDCARLLADAAAESDPASWHRGLANAWRLAPDALALLAALAAWRERTARELDKPRSHVVPDHVLVMTAQRRPATVAHLREFPDFHPAALRRFGPDLVRIVADGAWPPVAPVPPPLPRESKGLLADLKALVSGVADTHGIEPEVLARRRQLEALVLSARDGEASLPPMLSGWRRALVGDRLLDAVRARQDEIRSWPEEGHGRGR